MNREERLERTMSMAQNKGLLNNPGENNCFLNSAVQVFWHLDLFRRSFREIKGHFCMGKSCIFCALQNIFKDFQYSSNDALPPDTLRMAMASTFKDQRKFQMGDMDDAAECFETILSRMHFHLAMDEHDDGCSAEHCISHKKFSMQLIEQTICQCGERSEPHPFFQMVHYVSASALCAQARKIEKHSGEVYNHVKHFGLLLRMTGEDTRACPSPECNEKIRIQRLLLNCPDIVSVGLNWDSESPDADHITEVLMCIGTTLKLPYLFHQVYDDSAKQATLNLVGIVTYYGKHYSTFFYHSKLKTWIYFDDARVKEIGPDWSIIREKCRRCHYQPLLLLYANPYGTPIYADTAPIEKILINESTFVRNTDTRSVNRRLSAEVHRHDNDRLRQRKKRPSTSDSFTRETDSENSTLKSESGKITRLSFTEGNDDTLKARDNNWNTRDDEDTLKANDRTQRLHRHDLVPMKKLVPMKDHVSPKSRRSKSCDALDEGSSRSRKPVLTRTCSTGSDVTETLKRKKHERASTGKGKTKKTGLKRIGSAIFHAMRPAVAISHMKQSRRKTKTDRRPSDTSTDSNGDRSSFELSNHNPGAVTKQELLKLSGELAKTDDYLRSPSHDSGIGSATGSVSSSDTNHGGSDEDLVEYSHTLYALRNGYNTKSIGPGKPSSKGPHHEQCEVLLQEAENMVIQSQNAENSGDIMSAFRFCSEASSYFQRATEISGATSNNVRYALIKTNQCQTKSRQLRKKIEAQSAAETMSRTAKAEEEFLRQQRYARPGTVSRNVPTYRQIYPPKSVPTYFAAMSAKPTEVPSVKPDARINQDYQSLTEPTTLPIKPRRTSSTHYMSKIGPLRNIEGVPESTCTQRIKPDSMCYSPSHYDDLSAKLQGINIHPTSRPSDQRARSDQHLYQDQHTLHRNPDIQRVYTNMNETPKPRPVERRVSSTATIYLQQQRFDNVPPKTYDPQRYNSPQQEPQRQTKVFYAGASDVHHGKDSLSRSYNNTDSSSLLSSSAPVGAMLPNYRPAPPSYKAVKEARTSTLNNSVQASPWYQENGSVHSEPIRGSLVANDLRALSTRIISEKPVCQNCFRVQVDRQQRICAGCTDEKYRRHRQLQDGTDMLY